MVTKWTVRKDGEDWVAEAPCHHDPQHTDEDAIPRVYPFPTQDTAFRVAGVLAASDARY